MKKKKLVICVDFDGTCTTHEYPKVGREIGAVPVLRKLVAAGHKLVLFTMRSGKEQTDAEKWFASHDLPLYGSNVNPAQKHWTASPKAYGQIYIDDAALGCPLIDNGKDRPYVDWDEIEQLLLKRGVLEYKCPIKPAEVEHIFNEITDNIMNGETAHDFVERTSGQEFKLEFSIDAGRHGTDHSGSVTINTEKKTVKCWLSEYL